ncbi:MAG: hypothetical protein AAFX87_01485 [Bacteroidota bacterium]
MKKVFKFLGVFLLVLILTYSGWYASHGQSLAQTKSQNVQFRGTILAASDADMIAGAYANGILNKVDGIEDQVAMIDASNGEPKLVSSIEVSNSVISWPAIIDWHSKKQLAYVVETRGVHDGESQKMKNVFVDFPTGQKITVIDYSNKNKPVILQEKHVGKNLHGVSVNATGNLLVYTSTEKGKELAVSRLKDGLVQTPYYFTDSEVVYKKPTDEGFRTVEFHPTLNVIAVNLGNKKVLFFKVEDDGTHINLRKVGEGLEVAKKWSVGNWHPSGKYFILTDVAWGNGNLGFLFHGKGKLVSVGYDDGGNHKVVSKIKVGLSPEGADISPDGQYAVTVNMRRTWAPPSGFWFVPAKKYSSLSLVKINQETGELTKLGQDYGFNGALPEDVIFDRESNTLAVAVYHDREELHPEEGWIDFWELENDELINTGKQIKVTRGVHNLLLID